LKIKKAVRCASIMARTKSFCAKLVGLISALNFLIGRSKVKKMNLLDGYALVVGTWKNRNCIARVVVKNRHGVVIVIFARISNPMTMRITLVGE
jgi:hypothetical protein